MNALRAPGEPAEDLSRRHEQGDMRIRPIVMSGVGLFVLIALTLVAMGGVFRYLSGSAVKPERPLSSMAETQSLPPEPRLQVDPSQDLKEWRTAEEAVLTSYGWVDRQAGIVRIPIDRAMQLLVERPGSRAATHPK